MAANKQSVSIIATILLELDNDNDFFVSSSSSSDDELIDEYLLFELEKKRRVPQIKNYVKKIIPIFSPSDFKSHFRMEPSTFDYIENKISRNIENCSGSGRTTVSSRKQILMILWLLATPESYRSISDRFNVSKSTLWTSFYRVCKEISSLSSSEIKWPTVTEMKSIANSFKSISSFPNVIGCIDGSHIPIIAPVIHPVSYINRKGFHSVILQGIVNNRCLFTDCYAGEPGSVHDARVFRRSLLGRELQNKFHQRCIYWEIRHIHCRTVY